LINLCVSDAVEDKSGAPHRSLVNHRKSSPWDQHEWDIPSEVIALEVGKSELRTEDEGGQAITK